MCGIAAFFVARKIGPEQAKALTPLDVEGVGLFETVQIQVLIFDTDRAFRRNVSERLHIEGFTIFEAGDETEATGVALNRNIDVVLLGARGATQSGLEFLKFIKQNRPLTEVILMTPLDEHSLFGSIEAMKLGAFDDLIVPFDIETLLGRVFAAGRLKKENEEKMWLHSLRGKEKRLESEAVELEAWGKKSSGR